LINLTTSGQVWLAACLYQPQGWTGISANGSGVLATATFQAADAGESSLNLFSKDPLKPDEIKLAADPEDPTVVPIPNTAIDGHVTISPDPDPIVTTILGDVSGEQVGIPDGKVDMRDIGYLLTLFNTRPSSPNWNPNVDINKDGVVDMRDVGIAAHNFNKHV
jgi:hypothetical protein